MRTLTTQDLQVAAPSIFALEPWQKMSDRYRFVPTIQVVNALQDANFVPVSAAQSRTRIIGKGEFTKHVVRFRQAMDLDARFESEIPEIVLINSHDGTSAYKLMMGIFRIVCGNGLVVATSMIQEISLRHLGSRSLPQQAIDASYRIIDEAPAVMNRMADWKAIDLTEPQQISYATEALKLRDSALELGASQILRYRRYDDNKPSLWATFNRVQENLIKGGLRGTSTNGRRIRTRSITSVNEDLRLNRALWNLTEETGNLITNGGQNDRN